MNHDTVLSDERLIEDGPVPQKENYWVPIEKSVTPDLLEHSNMPDELPNLIPEESNHYVDSSNGGDQCMDEQP